MKHQRSILKNPFVNYLSGYQNAVVSHIDIFWLFLSQRIFKRWNIASSMRTNKIWLATFSDQRRRNPSEKLDLLCLHNLVHLQIWIVIRHEKRPKISVNQFLWGELSTLFKCLFFTIQTIDALVYLDFVDKLDFSCLWVHFFIISWI